MRTIYVDKDIPRIVVTQALKPIWPGVIFSRLSPTRFVEIPDPPLPAPGWVRIKNIQCGICASDLALLSVSADPRIAPAALPGLQRFYLGHELVGEVSEVGSGVDSLKLGDRVVMDSENATCASQGIDPPCPQCARGNFMLCENSSAGLAGHSIGGGWSDCYVTHHSAVYKIPDRLSDDQAALVEPLSVGVRAVLRRKPGPGQSALVLGSGTIGLSTVQSIRALAPGCNITAVARYPQQAELARQLGADQVIDGKDLYAATAELTGAHLYQGMFGNRTLLGGFDVIYDCVGSSRTLETSLRCARAGGAVVMVGIKLRPSHLDLSPIWSQEVDLVGLYAHGRDNYQGRDVHDYDLVIELLSSGKLTADGFITHRFPLARWKDAVSTAMNKHNGSIKVLIDHRLG